MNRITTSYKYGNTQKKFKNRWNSMKNNGINTTGKILF